MTKYVNNNGVSEIWTNTKNYISAQLLGKSDVGHTHSASDITNGLASVATSGSYDDLGNKPTIPTNTSQLANDSGFITSSGSCNYASSAGWADSAGGVAWDNVSGKPSAFTPYFANGTWYNVGDDVKIGDHNVGGGLGICGLNANTRIDFCQYNNAGNYKSITFDGTTLYMNGNCDYATSAGSAGSVAWGNVSGRPSFATVATSGSYNDLSNKPTIPTVNNGTLTIQQNGVNVQTFTANQSGNATANIVTPAVNDGTLTIMVDGITAGTFTANQSTDTIVALTSGGGGSTDPLPIGSYIQFAGSQAPEGFLVCNGGAISRTTYSALFAVIGTTYGSGDGSTTFNLPNLTDRFLQGSTSVGTVKDAGLPNITGSIFFKDILYTAIYTDSAFYFTKENSHWSYKIDQWDTICSQVHLDASRSNSIYGSSSTVQPPALTCLICIKY